MVKVIGHNIQ